MLNSGLEGLRDYPFQRLAALIGVEPPRSNLAPIDLSVGEPRRKPPAFVSETIDARHDTWNRYPPINGTLDLNQMRGFALTEPPGTTNGEFDVDQFALYGVNTGATTAHIGLAAPVVAVDPGGTATVGIELTMTLGVPVEPLLQMPCACGDITGHACSTCGKRPTRSSVYSASPVTCPRALS